MMKNIEPLARLFSIPAFFYQTSVRQVIVPKIPQMWALSQFENNSAFLFFQKFESFGFAAA